MASHDACRGASSKEASVSFLADLAAQEISLERARNHAHHSPVRSDEMRKSYNPESSAMDLPGCLSKNAQAAEIPGDLGRVRRVVEGGECSTKIASEGANITTPAKSGPCGIPLSGRIGTETKVI
jgi:hypothetical protein